MSLIATTKLEAVNTLLKTIGEAPVATLVGNESLATDVQEAISTLDEVSREVQSAGWTFNREKDYPLTRAADNQIVVPLNAAKVDVDKDVYYDIDPVLRGTKLYDRTSHTYYFTKDLKAEIVFLLEFEELPETARRYILLRASRMFQDRAVGSSDIRQTAAADETAALYALQEEEGESGDYSIFDNYTVSRTLDR